MLNERPLRDGTPVETVRRWVDERLRWERFLSDASSAAAPPLDDPAVRADAA